MTQTRQSVGEESRFDGGLLGLIGINIGAFLLTIFTFGLGFPWATVMKYRWYIKHSRYNNEDMVFDGTGGQLIGSFLLWIFFSILTMGIYALVIPIKLRDWKVKHTHFETKDPSGDGVSKFTGNVFGLFGINLLCLLINIITLFIAVPSTIAMKTKWEKVHTHIDGHRLFFDGHGIQLLGRYIGWMLLTIVTLGIYGLWLPLKFENWIVSHTSIVDPENEEYIEKSFWYLERYQNPELRKRALTQNMVFAGALIVISLVLLIDPVIAIVSNIIELIKFSSDFNFQVIISILINISLSWGITIVLYASIILLALSGIKGKIDVYKMVRRTFIFHIIYLGLYSLLYEFTYLALHFRYWLLSFEFFVELKSLYNIARMIPYILGILVLLLTIISTIRFSKRHKAAVDSDQSVDHEKYLIAVKHSKIFIVYSIISALMVFCIPISYIIISPLFEWTKEAVWYFTKVLLGILSFILSSAYLAYFMSQGIGLIDAPEFLEADFDAKFIKDYIVEPAVELPPLNKDETPIVVPPQTVMENADIPDDIDKLLKIGRDIFDTSSPSEEQIRIGLKAFNDAADLGSGEALAEIGLYYEKNGQVQKASDYYKQGYERGSSYAAFLMGHLYEYNEAFGIDRYLAYSWYKKSADLGNPVGAWYVAGGFYRGVGVAQDLTLALHYYEMASNGGVFYPALILGVQYFEGGELVTIDAHLSEKHLLNAMNSASDDKEKGDAYNALGRLYMACYAQDETYKPFLYRGLWFFGAGAKVGDSNARENLEIAKEFLADYNQLMRQVSVMEQPKKAIVPTTFYKEGRIAGETSFGSGSVSSQINEEDYAPSSGTRTSNPPSGHATKTTSNRTNSLTSGHATATSSVITSGPTSSQTTPTTNSRVNSPTSGHSASTTSTQTIITQTRHSSGFRNGISDDEVIELNGIINWYLITLFIKLFFFGAGLGIILYVRAHIADFGVISILFIFLGIIVAGLPGIFKSFDSSVKFSKKLDRFFRVPEYKANIDSDGNIHVRKNEDWGFIIFNTLLNLVYYAISAPFEFIFGIIKVIYYKKKIKNYFKH